MIIWFILSYKPIHSQQDQIYIGTNIPLYYTAGYSHLFNNNLSLNTQFSLLTKPYDKIILDVLEIFDTDELLLNTIGEAFNFGYNIQPEFNYHFGKNYLGVSYSYLKLKAEDHPSDIISNYLNIYIPTRRNVDLTVQSTLHNAGLLYGHCFDMKNPQLSLNLEFSVQKTFASKTNLKTETIADLIALSSAVDKELNEYYVKYGVLPSINIFFTYTFHKKE